MGRVGGVPGSARRVALASVAASPVGLHCLDVADEVLGQADAKDLEDRGQVSGRATGGQTARDRVRLQGRSGTWRRAMPTKTAHIQVVLQPLSNWPTQPLVWMKPCCSSLPGDKRAPGSARPPTATRGPRQSGVPSSAWPRALYLSACHLEPHQRAFSLPGVSAQTASPLRPSPDCPAPTPLPPCF